MSDFHQFSSLPKELQLEIWRFAAEEPRRIIKLDIEYRQIDGEGPGGRHQQETILYTGSLTAQEPVERCNLVWPPTSQQNVANLLLACQDAREVVLKRYPDLIRIEEAVPGKPEAAAIRRRQPVLSQDWWSRMPSGCPRRHFMLRCDFATDLVYIRAGCGNPSFVFSEAYCIADICQAFARPCWPEEYRSPDPDLLRKTLRQIRHMVIENPRHRNVTANDPRRLDGHEVVAAATGLESLYICPYGTRFEDEPTHFVEASDEAWEGELPENVHQDVQGNIERARSRFERNSWRFLGPLCYDTPTSEIIKMLPELSGLKLNYHDYLVMAIRLLRGRARGRPTDAVKLELRLRTSKAASDAESDAVWLPKIGHIHQGDGQEPAIED